MRSKWMSRGVAAALTALFCTLAMGQGAAVERAQEAFEQERYEESVAMLLGSERTLGRSPRVESIRALALAELGRTREAYASALAYESMTRNIGDLGRGHVEMMLLLKDLKARLESERKRATDEVEKLRMAEAARVVQRKNAQVQSRLAALRQQQGEALLKARVASSDAKAFDAALRADLGTQATGAINQIRKESVRVESELIAQINTLILKRSGQELQLPVFSVENAALTSKPPYRLLTFKLSDKSIEMRIIGNLGGSTIEESTRIQGFDLSRIQPDGFEILPGDGGKLLRFRFPRPDLWASGTTKYTDGRIHSGGDAPMRGSQTLLLSVSESVADETILAFQELLKIRRP